MWGADALYRPLPCSGRPRRPTSATPRPGTSCATPRLAVDGTTEGLIEGLLPALDDLCDDGGAIRLGAMSLLVDYAAGMLAMQTVAPDWTVTHDLALHLTGLAPPEGELEANCHLARAGRTAVISETDIRTPTGLRVARAYVTFNRVSRREGAPGPSHQKIVNLAEADEVPRRPLDEAIGFRFSQHLGTGSENTDAHWVEFDHIPFVYNSLGAIQGGVVALALERCGSWAAQADWPTLPHHRPAPALPGAWPPRPLPGPGRGVAAHPVGRGVTRRAGRHRRRGPGPGARRGHRRTDRRRLRRGTRPVDLHDLIGVTTLEPDGSNRFIGRTPVVTHPLGLRRAVPGPGAAGRGGDGRRRAPAPLAARLLPAGR